MRPPETTFVDQTSLMSSPDDASQGWDGFYMSGLMMAGTVYGGLHLLVWKSPFTNLSEQWLWRYTCIITASLGPLALFYRLDPVCDVMYRKVIQPGYESVKNWMGECATLCIQMLRDCSACLVITMALVSYTLLYIAARFYLIVQCLTSLAHLPPEIYVEPSWGRYLPHWGSG